MIKRTHEKVKLISCSCEACDGNTDREVSTMGRRIYLIQWHLPPTHVD